LWEANTAQTLGETLLNDWGVRTAGQAWWEVDYNPNTPPLSQVELMATKLWPAAVKSCPPLGDWVRGDFFRLDALIEKIVPAEGFTLIGDLGRFWSILRLAERWRVANVSQGLRQLHHGLLAGEDPFALAQEIAARFASLAKLEAASERCPDGLLARALRRGGCVPVCSTPLAERDIDALCKYVQDVTQGLPELLLGAVEIENGRFVAFSSTRAPEEYGITCKAARATAALAQLFPAVEVQFSGPADPDDPDWSGDGNNGGPSHFWDGLLSQNPPLRDFTADLADPARKPDEIIVVQINAGKFSHAEQKLTKAIWDRRNQLAGNLSLNQEMAFLDSINRRNFQQRTQRLSGDGEPETDQHIHTMRLTLSLAPLEADLHRELGAVSKFDRSPALKDELMTHGGEQAAAFLAVRRLVRQSWNDVAHAAWIPAPLAGKIGQLAEAFQLSPIAVDSIEFSRSLPESTGSWDIAVQWHAHAVPHDKRDNSVRLRGSASLTVRDGTIVAGDMDHTRITRMFPIKAGAGAASPDPRAGRRSIAGEAGNAEHAS
jgi:predicted acylesterase/phospholipase RssA